MIVGQFEDGRPVDSQEIIDWLNIMALAHPDFEMGLENTARVIEYLTQDRSPPAKSAPTLRLVA